MHRNVDGTELDWQMCDCTGSGVAGQEGSDRPQIRCLLQRALLQLVTEHFQKGFCPLSAITQARCCHGAHLLRLVAHHTSEPATGSRVTTPQECKELEVIRIPVEPLPASVSDAWRAELTN